MSKSSLNLRNVLLIKKAESFKHIILPLIYKPPGCEFPDAWSWFWLQCFPSRGIFCGTKWDHICAFCWKIWIDKLRHQSWKTWSAGGSWLINLYLAHWEGDGSFDGCSKSIRDEESCGRRDGTQEHVEGLSHSCVKALHQGATLPSRFVGNALLVFSSKCPMIGLWGGHSWARGAHCPRKEQVAVSSLHKTCGQSSECCEY